MKGIRKIFSSKAGDSIVEIMVAVTVLLIVSAFFMRSVNIASNLIRQSDDMKKRVDSFCEMYYGGSLAQSSVGTGIKLRNAADGSELSINTKLYKAADDTMSMYSFGKYEVSRE